MRIEWLGMGAALTMAMAGAGAAQVRTIDPNQAIDGDLGGSARGAAPSPRVQPQTPDDYDAPQSAPMRQTAPTEPAPVPRNGETAQEARADATTHAADTYQRDDLLSAGEGVFGKGAAGLAGLLEKILKDQGQPNAYIAGHEASGAFIVGLRYGSGIMTHKIEGQQPVFWTGPSIGFDAGGDANKVFVLVYNLYDTEDLYHRFPAAEGRLYAIGGFSATYLRRGKVVLIPIRLGVGWRAGVNVGYMNITHKTRWLPF
ncbi:DUF1134 domain-containing protein [Sphingomonas sp. CROZ-RG-20F-R02-07]|uniref:DUF1134 domain-containing protein n=1 Tax=Sphingomonas sp. CROZ-RG-20F-R02-07 TaxID=2914832 RepID=UPI001F5ADFE0|nr:DUF1134 domain-containing protein [Sphingomonas sp. CROZ-RG-20F-R02-07]